MTATRLEQIDKSSIAEHSLIHKHMIDLDTTKVLYKGRYYYKRIIKKVVRICKDSNKVSKDTLRNFWKIIL